jgi:TonB family protein
MSADEDEVEVEPKPVERTLRPTRSENVSALWWLAKWIGLPLVVVVALYYSEPLFRGDGVEVVPTVTRQEVHPYPFPEGSAGPSLAPPEVPRSEPVPGAPPLLPAMEDIPSADIVASPVAQPQPEYPRRALEAEKEGIVRLRITIGPDGSVIDAVVLSAQPRGWFENAAVSAVKRWRYRPSGRTIQTEVEIEFKLA